MPLLRGAKGSAQPLLRGTKEPAQPLLRGAKDPAQPLLRGDKESAQSLVRVAKGQSRLSGAKKLSPQNSQVFYTRVLYQASTYRIF
jgi:hypothetical protein